MSKTKEEIETTLADIDLQKGRSRKLDEILHDEVRKETREYIDYLEEQEELLKQELKHYE